MNSVLEIFDAWVTWHLLFGLGGILVILWLAEQALFFIVARMYLGKKEYDKCVRRE